MRKALIAIDRWLIMRLAEPVAWWIEHKTGVSQFGLARYVLAVLLAGDVGAFYLMPRQLNEPVSLSGLAIGMLVLMVAVRRSNISEEKAWRMNDNHHETAGGRIERGLFWAFTFYLVVSSLVSARWQNDALYRAQIRLFVIGNAAYLAFLYFCACRMKPPEYGLEPAEARVRG